MMTRPGGLLYPGDHTEAEEWRVVFIDRWGEYSSKLFTAHTADQAEQKGLAFARREDLDLAWVLPAMEEVE